MDNKRKTLYIPVPSNYLETIPDPDRFGYHNGYCKVERGWLTDETVIQFKLFNNPIKIWKNRLQNRSLFIKVCTLFVHLRSYIQVYKTV